MFADAFDKLGRKDSHKILTQINPLLNEGGFNLSAHNIIVLVHELSFYPGYYFIDMADHDSMPPHRKYAIYKQDGMIEIIDSTAAPIYRLNDAVPLRLNEQNVKDYIRFFLRYIRGPQGRFVLIESLEDINWREDPPPAATKALGKLVAPMEITSGEEGNFTVAAKIMFQTGLFDAQIIAGANGRLDINVQDLLVDDMPVLDDILD